MKPTKTVAFEFQEIPLKEALNVVLAGNGNYADIKTELLEKLPTLAPDRAFAFGLGNGTEVPEDERRGLCTAVNITLHKAKVGWRVTYSGRKRMFICVPQTNGTGPSPVRPPGFRDKHHQDKQADEQVLALRAQGKKPPEIAKITGMALGRVIYLCYKVFPERQKTRGLTIQDIEAAACKEFGIVPALLHASIVGKENSKIRNAIIFLARKSGTEVKEAAEYYGFVRGTIEHIAQRVPNIRDTIKRLEGALS